MAFSLNKIMLIGHLGKDAETRFTPSNLSVTTFTMATTFSYKGKNGDWVKETTWHNIVGYNLSDFFKENLKKGKKFYVEGRLTKRDYTDKDGNKRYSTDIISDKLIPLDPVEASASEKEDEQVNGGTDEINVENNEDLPF